MNSYHGDDRLDETADSILNPATEPGAVEVPKNGFTPDLAQDVRDVLTLIEQIEGGDRSSANIEAVRAMLNAMRQYDPMDPNLDSAAAAAIDDFCAAVDSWLAGVETGDRDGRTNEGVVGNPANIGKSLGQIAEELFPEDHVADAWGKPAGRTAAPGAGLAQFYHALLPRYRR
jgi:hypothetical protein